MNAPQQKQKPTFELPCLSTQAALHEIQAFSRAGRGRPVLGLVQRDLNGGVPGDEVQRLGHGAPRQRLVALGAGEGRGSCSAHTDCC